jgi:trk system potassium uptake protein TrkH
MNSAQASALGGVIERFRTVRLSPAQIIIFSFETIIVLGTLLLLLPISTTRDEILSPLEALFTATSAVCVTGLVVLDTQSDFTLFGQIVILTLIQIGGLGYMTLAVIFLSVLGKRIGLQERMAIQEALSTFTLEGLIRFCFGIIKFTVLVEFTGAVLLAVRFLQDMTLSKAIYFGIFHSISAFNNAGFSLFSNSLIPYRSDPMVNGVVIVLVVMGGIGFLVYQDIVRLLKREVFRLSLHTKIVLSTTAVLILVGWLAFWVFETRNPVSLQNLSWKEQGTVALFHSITARTAGFNTIDIGTISAPTMYLLALLMMIGASPGGTGGGIKTTTFVVMVVAILSVIRGRQEATLFYRRLSLTDIAKAFLIGTMAMALVTGATLLLLYSEDQNMLRTLFEVASAFGTVGLSTGDGGVLSFSALFSGFGKAVIILTMFLGRIGPLAFGVSARPPRPERFRYPEGKIMIG